MDKDLYYTTEDLRKKLNYSTKATIVYSMKNSKKGTLTHEIWNCRVPKKVGRNFLFRKSQVDKLLKENHILGV